jgi:IclR family transcriptional regulator, acetate operon repressor
VPDQDDTRLVGADRVLATLVELAHHPHGVTLEELARRLQSPKPTVHRALAVLRRAHLATRLARGVYLLGDEYLRLAYEYQAARPESARIQPALQELAERYGETAHFAVLDGAEVVYRAKIDPPSGSVRLTSTIGGRNPAHLTAVGKQLLSSLIDSEEALRAWVGGRPLLGRTPNSITDVAALWKELQLTRARGYAVDDQENELGINCVAVGVPSGADGNEPGAVSVSAVAFRLPIARLEAEVPTIRSIVGTALADDSPAAPRSGKYQRGATTR